MAFLCARWAWRERAQVTQSVPAISSFLGADLVLFPGWGALRADAPLTPWTRNPWLCLSFRLELILGFPFIEFHYEWFSACSRPVCAGSAVTAGAAAVV